MTHLRLHLPKTLLLTFFLNSYDTEVRYFNGQKEVQNINETLNFTDYLALSNNNIHTLKITLPIRPFLNQFAIEIHNANYIRTLKLAIRGYIISHKHKASFF